MVNAVICEEQYKNYGTLTNPVVCIEDAAKLENIGVRGMNKKIIRGQLKYITIEKKLTNQNIPRGIYVEQLSISAQCRYYESLKSARQKVLEDLGLLRNGIASIDATSEAIKKAKPGEIVRSVIIEREQNKKDLKLLDEVEVYNRKRAFERYQVLEKWSDYEIKSIRSGEMKKHGKLEILKKFLDELSGDMEGKKISVSTFYEWEKKYKEDGVKGLATEFGKACGVWETRDWNSEARIFFKELYLRQSKPSAKECYKEIKRIGKTKNWKIPTYRTILKFIETIPYSQKVFGRGGMKELNDKVLPYFDRDPESISANEIWVADHHQLDIAVKWWDGSIIFPWVTMFIDMRSWKIVGWALTNTPNSQSIMTALKRGIKAYGIPDYVYIDNGKDFVSRQFMGGELRIGKALKNDEVIEINGIYGELGIKTKNALPFNPQAKTIERLFAILEEQFGKFSKGYRGNRVINRPEQLKNEIANGNLYNISQFKNMFDGYVIRYNAEEGREESKYLKGLSPDRCYAENLKKSPVVNPGSLRLLMMPIGDNEIKTVRRNGIYLRRFEKWYNTNSLAKLRK